MRNVEIRRSLFYWLTGRGAKKTERGDHSDCNKCILMKWCPIILIAFRHYGSSSNAILSTHHLKLILSGLVVRSISSFGDILRFIVIFCRHEYWFLYDVKKKWENTRHAPQTTTLVEWPYRILNSPQTSKARKMRQFLNQRYLLLGHWDIMAGHQWCIGAIGSSDIAPQLMSLA